MSRDDPRSHDHSNKSIMLVSSASSHHDCSTSMPICIQNLENSNHPNPFLPNLENLQSHSVPNDRIICPNLELDENPNPMTIESNLSSTFINSNMAVKSGGLKRRRGPSGDLIDPLSFHLIQSKDEPSSSEEYPNDDDDDDITLVRASRLKRNFQINRKIGNVDSVDEMGLRSDDLCMKCIKFGDNLPMPWKSIQLNSSAPASAKFFNLSQSGCFVGENVFTFGMGLGKDLSQFDSNPNIGSITNTTSELKDCTGRPVLCTGLDDLFEAIEDGKDFESNIVIKTDLGLEQQRQQQSISSPTVFEVTFEPIKESMDEFFHLDNHDLDPNESVQSLNDLEKNKSINRLNFSKLFDQTTLDNSDNEGDSCSPCYFIDCDSKSGMNTKLNRSVITQLDEVALSKRNSTLSFIDIDLELIEKD